MTGDGDGRGRERGGEGEGRGVRTYTVVLMVSVGRGKPGTTGEIEAADETSRPFGARNCKADSTASKTGQK